VAARFVPALGLAHEPAWAARLLALTGHPRAAAPMSKGPPTNLPTPLTPFVGRERELTELHLLLSDPVMRLISLTGPGGIGKSRLAMQAAGELLREHANHFRDGIWFVPLASVPAAELVVFAVANVLGLRSTRDEAPRGQLVQYLRERAALLVLDNFEHLLPAGELVTELLQQAPRVKALVTSRERLGLRGEWVLEVAGLDLPAEDEETPRLSSAVRLFVTSGRQASAGFSLGDEKDGENRAAVYRICRLVEGMPLALELAAAWLPVLAVGEIAEELERGLDLLSPAVGSETPRQRSLRAVFDRSWRLLTERERAAFRRLAVFRGGFTREAAHAIAGADLTDLASLVAKALIRRSGARYDLHELLRQYGLEQLEAAGEAQTWRDRHLAYFLTLGAEAEAASAGPGEVTADRQLQEELDNIRGALSHALERNVAAGLALASALAFLWPRRNILEGRTWLHRLLEQPAATAAGAARAKARLALAQVTSQSTGDFDSAQAHTETALELYQSLGDERGAAWALCYLGEVNVDLRAGFAQTMDSLAAFRRLGDVCGQATALSLLGHMHMNRNVDQAREYLTASLGLCRELRWPSAIGGRLTALGRLALLHGEFDQAQAYLAEAMALGSGIRDVFDVEEILALRAELGLRQGQYDQAEADYEACIARCREVGWPWLAHWAQTHLGRVKVAKGLWADAQALFASSLRFFHGSDTRSGICYAGEGLAGLALSLNDPARAVRLIAWADHTRLTDGDVRPPVEQREVDGVLAKARAQVDEAAFAAAWAEGEAMTVDEVVAYALAQDDG
jgi:predicted ATPase